MSGSFSNAWSWSLKRSPLMAAWRCLRGFHRPNRDAFALLKAAGLPGPVDAVIRTTVKRTKLWRDEREQIARELIAHARDAIEAGRTPEQIVETFGDPRRIARLMRRSMKRKRPLVWQAYRLSRRAAGVMLLLVLVLYAAIAVRFYTSTPRIKVDYGAMLNERNKGYAEDEKSWPIISDAGLRWSQISYTLGNQQAERVKALPPAEQETGMSIFPDVPIKHPDYASIAHAVRDFAPDLARVREAAARPIVGVPVGYETTTVRWEGRDWTQGIIPADADAYKQRAMIEVLLPNLGPTRGLAQVLMFDARLALGENDEQRATDDYIAALGLARQCRGEPFMISRLVGIALHELVIAQLQEILRARPGAFTAQQLTMLAHTNAMLQQTQRGLGLETERMMFKDTLQRVYSDNGRGNGHLTPEGFRYMGMLMRDPADLGESLFEDAVVLDARLRAATMPLTLVTSLDREQDAEVYKRAMDQTQRVIEQGPAWIASINDAQAEMIQQRDSAIPFRLSMSGVMLPALQHGVDRYFQHQMRADAFATMLAIEVFRREHTRLPSTLAELSPGYLPRIPQDLMNPGRPIQYRMSGDGYILYSAGSDGDDDGGKEASEAISNRSVIRQEQRFSNRFTQAYSPTTGEPMIQPDGAPVLAAPTGPDSDWILIDMRHTRN